MSAIQKQKSLHDEFKEITEQIKRLEEMRVENHRQIRKLQNDNQALTQTIKQLKIKRRQLAFFSIHIPER